MRALGIAVCLLVAAAVLVVVARLTDDTEYDDWRAGR